jgi:hypothetical protein
MNSKTLLSIVIICSTFIGLVIGTYFFKTIDVTSPNIATTNSGDVENIFLDSTVSDDESKYVSGDIIVSNFTSGEIKNKLPIIPKIIPIPSAITTI